MERDVGGSLLDGVIPIMWKLGTVVIGILSVGIGLLYAKQDSLLYFPEIGGIPRRPGKNPRRYRSPEEYHVPFETHFIRCDDGVTIHSWLIIQKDAKIRRAPTLVFFHGNAGNIGLRLPNAVQMLNQLKANVLLVEYRGYGDSDDATPSEKGIKLDAEAALQFISKYNLVDSERIFLFGRSLGGAAAFHLAQFAEQKSIPLAGIIVENTFLSISRMVDHLMPIVAPFKSLVLRIGWNSFEIAPTLKTPILYLAGAADQLVPHSHMLELYKSSGKSSRCARIHVVKDGTHNETWVQGGREYWQAMKNFMNEVFASEAGESFRSMTSLEDVSLEPQSSKGVAIGVGSDVSTQASSIPIMPSSIIGIAREATSSVLSTQKVNGESNGNKKKL